MKAIVKVGTVIEASPLIDNLNRGCGCVFRRFPCRYSFVEILYKLARGEDGNYSHHLSVARFSTPSMLKYGGHGMSFNDSQGWIAC